MRSIFLLPVAMFVLIALFFAWPLLTGRDASVLPSVLIDQPAPALVLPAVLDGVPGLDAEAFKGKIVLVNLFASWCPPCQIEHPVLIGLARQRQVEIYGINYKDKQEDARAWLGRLGNPYARIGADLNGRAGIEWGSYGVPETFVVDAQGKIRYRHVGPVTAEVWEKVLAPIVKALSATAPKTPKTP